LIDNANDDQHAQKNDDDDIRLGAETVVLHLFLSKEG